MHCSLRTLVAALAVVLTALAPGAYASTLLDFEDPDLTGPYFSGDSFDQSGYRMTQFNGAGTIDTGAALGAAAPTNDGSQFYSSQNEGRLRLVRVDGGVFDLDGFSAAYVPLLGSNAEPQWLLIAVGFVHADGSAFFSTFTLGNTLSSTEGGPFVTFSGAQLADQYTGLLQASFFACATDDGVECNADQLQNNGQFALDDVRVTSLAAPVPEPATSALMGLGLLALVLKHRRGLRLSSRGAL